jgi:hypothetical protein
MSFCGVRSLIWASAVAILLVGCRTGGARPLVANEGPNVVDSVRFCSETTVLPSGAGECAGEVTPDVARQRHRIIRVVSRAGRVLSEELVNGLGYMVDDRWGAYRYAYGPDGALVARAEHDRYGVLRSVARYTEAGRREARLDPWGAPAVDRWDENNDWLVAAHEYDARGQRVRSRYQDALGAPRHLSHGSSEVRRIMRDFQLVEDSYFDERGQAMNDRDGDHRGVREPTPWGVRLVRHFSTDGTPNRSRGRRYGARTQFDAIGNVLWEDKLDANGLPASVPGEATREAYTYDRSGNRVETRLLRADGGPAEGAFAFVRRTFDARGNPTVITYLDAEGLPSRTAGYARADITFDEVGGEIAASFFRGDGSPGRGAMGPRWAKQARTYDERHNLVEIRNLSADGSPGVDADGVSVIARRYQRDRLVEIERRGPQGELRAVRGVARVSYVRDVTGRVIERRFDDASDHAVAGIDVLTYRVDYAGAKAAKPGLTRTREEARSRADELVRGARAGRSIFTLAEKLADNPSQEPETEVAIASFLPEIRAALLDLPIGGLTEPVDTDYGFFVLRRLK